MVVKAKEAVVCVQLCLAEDHLGKEESSNQSESHSQNKEEDSL